MSFNNSQVIVAGPAINDVARDQFNVTGGVVHIGSRADDDGEFKRVTTGEMYLLKEIHRFVGISGCSCPRCRTQRMIYSVELPERKMKCTAITYNGPRAQEDWEEDFRRFSQNRSPGAWQLYGLNRSNVPFLIFHDELVPLGHFYKTSFWGDFFVNWLGLKLGCNESEVWLNTRGSLIEGPRGPDFEVLEVGAIDEISIPSSAEMLEDDISFQFFQKFPSTMLDDTIVDSALWHFTSSSFDDFARFLHEEPFNNPPENTPGIINGLHFDTVYSPSLGAVARCRDGGQLWEMSSSQGLVDKTVMDDGLIRFKLDGQYVYAYFISYWTKLSGSWLSQSSRIIDACRMWGTEEHCFIVKPSSLILESIPGRYLNQQRLLPFENPPPIYLFIYPLPMTMSGIKSWKENRTHFWSLDGNGRSEMTEEECCRWKVPELVACGWQHYYQSVYRWSSHVYAAIRNWQVARGFDPTTADFAQSLGIPELDILIDNEAARSRFEEVHENSSTPDKQSEQSVPEELDTSPAVEVTIPQPSLTTSTMEPSQIPVLPKHSMVKTQPRAEISPQVQLMVEDSDPVSILGKRKRGRQIHTRRVRRRV